MEVGIRELKQKLSAYLERVAAGERLYVTDRGRVKAVITSPAAADAIARGVSEGRINAPARNHPRRPPLALQAEMSIAQALGEDRDER